MRVNQAPPLMAVQLRGLVPDMRQRAQVLPTAAERIAKDSRRDNFLRGFPRDEVSSCW